MQIKAVLLSNRYAEKSAGFAQRTARRLPPRAVLTKRRGVGREIRSLLATYSWVSSQSPDSGPLTELGLDDVVDVNADAADAALVDFDLMQVGGRVGVAVGGAPVVLPEIGAQAVL